MQRVHLYRIVGAIAMTLSVPTAAFPATEGTGAFAAFTSSNPHIIEARRLIDEGKFSQAAALLQKEREQETAAAGLLDIMERIRIAYDLGADGLLAKLRKSIPDVTADDLEKWRQAGQVQYRIIDGKVAYFGREPSNIFRFCEEARRRRKILPAETSGWKLEDHLARIIDTAQSQKSAEVLPMRHRIHYVLTINANVPHLKQGTLVRVWLPYPQEYLRQRDVKLVSSSPPFKVMAPTSHGEFPIEGPPQRTLYFAQKVTDPSKPMAFEETFEFTNSAYYPKLDDAMARPLPANWSGGNLDERPPHILFTPQLRETVAKVIGDETNPLAKARKIFHYVATNIAYCAEEEYGTIPSLSQKAFTSRRGDCGVQSMLFITMCRIAGIPARWQTGWETKRVDLNMHDWTEFYVEPWGWLPADPSYGLRDTPDPRICEFYFGHQDSYRMIVNRDYGAALVPQKLTLRSEPLDFQRGEVEVVDAEGKAHNLYFPYWDYDFNVEYLNDGP